MTPEPENLTLASPDPSASGTDSAVVSSSWLGFVDRQEVEETIERLKEEEYERLQRYENNEP